MRISKMIKSEINLLNSSLLCFILFYFFFCMHRPGLYHLNERLFHWKNLRTEIPIWIEMLTLLGWKSKKVLKIKQS